MCFKILFLSTKLFFSFLNLVSEETGRLSFGGGLDRGASGFFIPFKFFEIILDFILYRNWNL